MGRVDRAKTRLWMIVLLGMVVMQAGAVDGMGGLAGLFDGFDDKASIGLCFGLTKSVDLKALGPKMEGVGRARGVKNEQDMKAVFKDVMAWIIGNCYDTMIESSEKDKASIMMNLQKKDGDVEKNIKSKYLDAEEAIRLVSEGKKHHLHKQINSMLLGMEKTAEDFKKNPNKLKEQMDKMKDMNDKMTKDLETKMKGLDSGWLLPTLLGVFGLTLTILLGCGCYFCFCAGKVKNNDFPEEDEFDEEFLRKLEKYKRLNNELPARKKEERKGPKFAVETSLPKEDNDETKSKDRNADDKVPEIKRAGFEEDKKEK